MDRVAVLVDAGYFFAAGSALISTSGKQRREAIVFDENAAIDALRSMAKTLAGLPLLRIYWYDGASRRTGPTAEHVRLAHCNDIKVRLGFLNAKGQQKGVDSLIVTDLVELARNRAVSDVVLMSGDEDVRIGVQLAQSFGVRVHLLGIEPSTGTQSADLRQEADTCSEWGAKVVGTIISRREAAVPSQNAGVAAVSPRAGARPAPEGSVAAPVVQELGLAGQKHLDEAVESIVADLTPQELTGAVEYLTANANNVPYEVDSKVLSRCRAVLGRHLDDPEKRYVRARIRLRLREQAEGPRPVDRR